MKHSRALGKITYICTYPFIRIWLYGSHRAYVILVVKDEVLLTKNWLGLHQRWRLPGGGVHASESVLDGLVREISEEIGCSLPIKKVHTLGQQRYYKASKLYTYSLYTVKLNKKPRLHINHNEIADHAWFPIAKAKAQPLAEETRHALQLLDIA